MIKRAWLIIVLALTAALSPPSVPNTPAGQVFNAWLTTFNRDDRQAFRAFMQQYRPSPDLGGLDDWMQFRDQTGGFDLRKIERSTPTTLIVLLQEHASDQFARMILNVQPAAPHRIMKMALGAIPRPPEFALPHMSQDALIAALRTRAAQEAAADRFAGAVLVAKNGIPVFQQAYGLADRANNTPNTPDTRFRLGSMNKMFTATAILQLAQAGKIGLNDPIGKYLPEYPNKDVASKVNIAQLLTHTGGTGDIFGPEFRTHRLELRTLDDYVKLYGSRPLRFTPGTKWEYSNYGFILLGVIIEKVSGQSYYDYVHDHIFVPAGMTSTASDPEGQTVANRSVGYTKMDGPEWKANTGTLPYRGTSAGGGYSTVGDLLKFANALQANKLLSSEYTQMLTTGKVDTPMGGKYAYGFEERIINGTRCFGHGGGAPGMNGELQICPAPGYVIAVLANLDPPAAERVTNFITNRLPQK